MKKNYLLSVVLALSFLWTNAQNIVVSGASVSAVNGTYSYAGLLLSKPSYVFGDYRISYFGGVTWAISKISDGSLIFYDEEFGATEYATPDLVIEWRKNGGNVEPSVSVQFEASYGGGDGTSGDPYQIANLDQLENLSETSADWDKHFIQTADINATETENWNSGDGFSPIGNSTTKFTGTYNGQGYTIDSLFVTSSGVNKGLFGYCNGAEIKNLTLSEVTLTVDERNVGLLAGRVEASTVIDSVNTSGTINSTYSGGTWASPGGIVGRLDASTLSNSSADVSITSLAGTTGGLVGYTSSSSTVTKCYSTGTINQNGIYHGAGGIVGSTDGTANDINNCYSDINITGINWTTTDDSFDGLGGLIGRVKGSLVTVDNCYSFGTISSNMTTTSRISGLIGVNENADDSNITNCYWDTETSGQASSDGGTGKTTTEMKTEDTFASWDFASTWSIRSLNSISYPYLQAVVQNPAPGIEVTSYDGGDGTSGDPYQIATLSQLYKLSNDDANWDKYFIQTADINASATSGWNSNEGFSPIGNNTTQFTGTYDGDNFTIDSLFINRPAVIYQGLFGYKTDGELKNIVLTNVDITGSAWTGGLVGRYGNGSTTAGLIDSCSVTGGTVTATFNGQVRTGGLAGLVNGGVNVSNSNTNVVVAGEERLGGLIGEITVENTLIGTKGIVENCYALGNVNGTARQSAGLIGYMNINTILRTSYATGDVTGTDVSTGGLVGYSNTGTVVENCYALGNVTGEVHVGGLIGYNRANVTNCYSTGSASGTSDVGAFIGTLNAGTITDCFWDKQTSGSTTSAAGTGKNTAQLKVEATFTNWDFTSTWDIRTTDSVSYPYLTDITPTFKPGIQLPTATWLGADTAWSNTANWLTGSVPGSSDDVIINATDNDPVISNAPASPAETNALTIDASATLTIDGSKALTVNGDLTNNGTLTLESGATIITDGTVGGSGSYIVKQALAGTSESNTGNVSVTGAGTADANGVYEWNGSRYQNTNGYYFQYIPAAGIYIRADNDDLLYKSSTTSSSITEPYEETYIVVGAGTAPAPNVLEETVTSSPRNYYIGSPVSGATAEVFDNGDHSKFYHNPNEQRYYTLNNATTLNAGQGYVFRSPNAQTIEFSGTLNNNNYVLDAVENDDSNPFNGFNLIANPYTAYVDWKEVLNSVNRVEPTMWYRTFNGINNVFDTYNGDSEVGTNNNGNGAVNEFIPPMQGFWVRKFGPGTTGSVAFNKSMRSHQAGALRAPQTKDVFRFVIEKDGQTDEAVIVFDPNAQEIIESYDSRKMYSNVPAQVSTVVERKDLVINGLPYADGAVVSTKVTFKEDGIYTLEATEQIGALTNMPVTLEDKLTNTIVSFNAGEKYTFKGNTTDSDRFTIRFGEMPVSTTTVTATAPVIFVANNQVTVKVSEVNNAELRIVNVNGQVVQTSTVNTTYAQIPVTLTSGIYIVELINNGEITREKVLIQ